MKPSSGAPIEAEAKFALPDGFDVRALQVQLHRRGFVPSMLAQQDTYLGHFARDFGETDEALRVRKQIELPVGEGPLPPFPADGASPSWSTWLTYKGPKLEQRSKARVEIEVRTGATVAEALLLAGFRHAGEVRKVRQLWQAGAPNHKDLQVAIDHVDGLGLFVELERSTDHAGLAAVVDGLIDEAHELLGPAAVSERRSYLELIRLKAT